MTVRLLLIGLLGLSGPLSAQSVAGRWSLKIRGAQQVERGDLRFDPPGPRLLLESQDSAWLPIHDLVQSGSRITFRLSDGRSFEGVATSDGLTGTVSGRGRSEQTWQASPLQSGTASWPVLPRVVVRQLLVGSTASSSRYSSDWLKAILPANKLDAQYSELIAAAGFSPASPRDGHLDTERFTLGFDIAQRRALVQLLEQIEASPAADAKFRGLFRSRTGDWRVDIHDAAWQSATSQVGGDSIDTDGIARLLPLLGFQSTVAQPDDLRRAVWQYWQRSRADRGAIDRLTGAGRADIASAAKALDAVLAGYDNAQQWWLDAVTWLMSSPWLSTGDDWRSPAQLVAEFWGRSELTIPDLQIRHFGRAQAVPVIGAQDLGARLLSGINPVGTEYLGQRDGFGRALENWRSLEFAETTPLNIHFDDELARLGSPASVARSRLGGFVAAGDAIQIESAFVPLVAVGTVVHEWQHLLIEGARLTGPGTPGLREEEWGLWLVDGDPWLAEGAAEWMTDEILSSTATGTNFYAAIEAGKRMSIAERSPDNTHVLGYLLVRAAAERTASSEVLRELLVEHLHNPPILAKAIGLAGGDQVQFERPNTLTLIPEVKFFIDSGVADGATRRLIMPDLEREN